MHRYRRAYHAGMQVLIACESSGTVRRAFRALGHDAWSCDLLPADDPTPYHIKGDALPVMRRGWDLIIAHPPCTHLACSGARHFAAKRADGRQADGIALFMAMVRACARGAPLWAIENPVGIMSTIYRKPDQIIQPWQFGHGECKATCLWLGGLPTLRPSRVVSGREQRIHRMAPGPLRWKARSKTYAGIASAIADQWGGYADLIL